MSNKLTRKDKKFLGLGFGFAGLIALINLAFVALVVWGIVELVLFLKRN